MDIRLRNQKPPRSTSEPVVASLLSALLIIGVEDVKDFSHLISTVAVTHFDSFLRSEYSFIIQTKHSALLFVKKKQLLEIVSAV